MATLSAHLFLPMLCECENLLIDIEEEAEGEELAKINELKEEAKDLRAETQRRLLDGGYRLNEQTRRWEKAQLELDPGDA